MKAVTDYGITVDNKLGGERIAMKFDENSIAHIMSVLTDLYSDPELAVIREYSTNALDANIEAGNPAPIEVTLPSALSPYFRVKDAGVGMSVDDIHNIYSKYGASTKRDTDTQTGMLGLGCKSGLTYTNSFTIVAVKDGTKVQAMVSRVEDGTGVVEIVDESATLEPNGVEIVVPAKHASAFHTKAMQFFRFWEPGTVLVNGKAPDAIQGSLRVNSTMILADGLQSNIIVMGNVAYPCKESLSRHVGNGYGSNKRVVAWVPIGSVNFTPSREALHYTKRTNETIAKVRMQFDADLQAAAKAAVEQAVDHPTAYKMRDEWAKVVNQPYRYKGQDIPTEFKAEGWKYDLNGYRNSVQKLYNTRVYGTYLNAASTVIVYEFDGADVSTSQRKKVKLFLEQKGVSASTVYFVRDKVGLPWIPMKHFKWEEVKAFRLPRQPKGAVVPLNYDVWSKQTRTLHNKSTQDYWGWKNMPLVPGDKTIYFSPSEGDIDAGTVQELFPKWTILKLQKNRWDKFKRENPKSLSLVDAMKSIADEVRNGVSNDEILLLTADWYDKECVRNLDPTKIDDPALARVVALLKDGNAKSNTAAMARVERYNKLARRTGGVQKIELAKAQNALDNYPFIRYNGDVPREHVYEYVNAIFAKRS